MNASFAPKKRRKKNVLLETQRKLLVIRELRAGIIRNEAKLTGRDGTKNLVAAR